MRASICCTCALRTKFPRENGEDEAVLFVQGPQQRTEIRLRNQMDRVGQGQGNCGLLPKVAPPAHEKRHATCEFRQFFFQCVHYSVESIVQRLPLPPIADRL